MGLVRELVEIVAATGELAEQRLLIDVARGLGYGAECAFADEAGDGELALLRALGDGRDLGGCPADERRLGAGF